MPWLLSSQVDVLSSSPSERQCERTAFSFYCAVRDREPVWLLEDMRLSEVFVWEDGRPESFGPSDALLYALVHDHQDYARFLLASFSVAALRAPRCRFCRRRAATPHLKVAVRYDRASILAAIMEAVKDGGERPEAADGGGGGGSGCSHAADAGTSAVRLAVELQRADCLLLLLAHGAPAVDGVDAALQALVSCDASRRLAARRCLDLLLLFVSEPPPPLRRLQEEPQRWRSLLGNGVFGWLCGLAPPPLLLQALRSLARSGPDRIDALPEFLRPLGWR